MFKRYKIKPKVIRPLVLRSKTVGVSKRISDDLLKILSMLKHSSSTIRMRGAREADSLECIPEEMVREIMKMCKSDKKEVRGLFYKITSKFLSKALSAELSIWEEYIILYLETMMTCTVIDVRRDSLKLLDLAIKYFPEKINGIKKELEKWLKNDERIISIDPKYVKWTEDLIKRQKTLASLQKTKHVSSTFNSRVYLLHGGVFVNGIYKELSYE